MSGKKTISNTTPAIGAIKIQQSTYGVVIPIVWGRTRVTGNVIWYGDFAAVPHTTVTQQGGKGGGAPQQTSTTYTYTASVVMALCEGPALGIRTAWRGKNIFEGSAYSGTMARETHVATHPGAGGTIAVTNTDSWADVSVELRLISDYEDDFRYNRSGTWLPLVRGKDYTAAAGVYTFTNDDYAGTPLVINYTYRSTNSGMSCLSQIGLELYGGNPGQAPWSYLTSRHPSEAIGYSGVAYVAGANYSLDPGASVENHAFEVETSFMYSAGIPDADPSVIVSDALTNVQYGAHFGLEKIAPLTDYSNACLAQGIVLSPALTEQSTAASFLESMAALTNAGLVWSGGVLKVVPYTDTPITGNGVTFTPNTTPIYDLTDDDFQPVDDEGPIKVTRGAVSDSFNSVKLEYFDRANDYNIAIMEQADQADIQENGPRPMPVITAHWITEASVAKVVATLILQRSLFVRNTYEFKLGWTKIALEPMDLVTLTDPYLGMNKQPVRILSVEESEDGYLSITAEDFPKGSASATLYPTGSGSGYAPNFNEPPGAVLAPLIFEGPAALAAQDGGLEVWLSAGSLSPTYGGCEVWVSLTGSDFRRAAVLNGSSRYGFTTSVMPTATPGTVTTDSLGVSLYAGGQLLSASNADMAALTTLCYVDGEFLSYETSTLTGPSAYTIGGHMTRGAYLSRSGNTHALGIPFIRCDDAIAKMPLTPDYIGKTLHVKLLPFNRYGGALGNLSDAIEYTYTVTGWQANLPPIAPPNLGTEGPFTISTAKFKWDRVANAATYNVQIWAGTPLAKVREVNVGNSLRFDYSSSDGKADGGPWRAVTIKVQGIHANGAAGPFSTFAATNPQAGALTGVVVATGAQAVQFSCNRPADVDFAGIRVWISATSGFTPDASTLVFDGPGTNVTINRLAGGGTLNLGTTYYVRAAAYDTFGTDGLTYTTEQSVTISTTAGVQTATVNLYQWSPTVPANPTGTSTYTWTTGANGSYTASDGWSTTVPANPGTPLLRLYIATVQISAAAGTATTSVSYSASNVAAWSQNGQNGTTGVQSATATIYQWAATIPAGPAGTSTWTWASSTFTPVPSGWSTAAGTSASPGLTLWAAKVALTDSASVTTTSFNWSTASISAAGYAGSNGTAATYVTISTTSQVFSRATAAAAFAPTSVTLTATPFGGSATYQWQYWNGSTWTTISGATSATYSPASGDFTDARTYRVQATIGGTVYTDQITLVQVTGGTNAITGYLDNEAVTLAANSSGTVSSFAPASGTFHVFDGITDKTGNAAVTYSVASQTGCTVAINSAGAVSVSAMSTDTATAVFNAVYSGVTIARTLSLAKAKAGVGTSGSDGSSYVTAYCASSTASTSTTPSNTVGSSSVPATNDGGITGTWQKTVPALSSGQFLYQSDGIYNPLSGIVSWSIPYWSSVKVGSLSAITANLGSVTSGSMTSVTMQTASSGQRVAINESGNNKLVAYNSSGTMIAEIGGTSGVVYAPSTSGLTPAIFGTSSGSGLVAGVAGTNNGSGAGVNGNSSSGIGVYGGSSSGPGVRANSSTGNALEISGGANGIVQTGGGANWLQTLNAATDNAYDCGTSSQRWRNIYAASGVVSTSDERTKTAIEPSNLGMDFINALTPVSYLHKVAENIVTFRTVEVEPARYVVDDFGDSVLVAHAVTETVKEVTPRAGVRRHYGLLSQQVRAALTAAGVDDAAFWTLADPSDPESQQALRYEELMAPLIRAVQELSARLAILEVSAAGN
jgi:hypothetical protein